MVTKESEREILMIEHNFYERVKQDRAKKICKNRWKRKLKKWLKCHIQYFN